MSSSATGIFVPRLHSGSESVTVVIAPASEVIVLMRGRFSGTMSSPSASTRFGRMWYVKSTGGTSVVPPFLPVRLIDFRTRVWSLVSPRSPGSRYSWARSKVSTGA